MNNQHTIQAVRRWLEEFVIKFNICPFAGLELRRGAIKFVVSEATSEARLVADLENELLLLRANSKIETTLLIHPDVLQDFSYYNDFLTVVDRLLLQLELEGEMQIASFHPDYQFAGTATDDAENFTNRAPFPILHILREASVSKAVDGHPDVESIPANNIKRMNSMGASSLRMLMAKIKSG